MALDGIWPSKLGATQGDFPGSSPHVAPSDFNLQPYFAVVDCNNLQVTPVIDAGGCIWVCGNFRNSFKGVIKLDAYGGEVLRIPLEDQIVATPVLANGYIYLAIDTAVVASYGLETGAERWSRRYAPGCGNDAWSMGYNQDVLVLAGKSNEALPWNNCVYGVSANSGSLRWKFEATLIIFFTPCMVHGSVIFQDMQCTVTSLRLSDGKATWQEKFKSQDKSSRQRSTSTGQAVACKSLNTVYAAGNRPGKKEWNAQYGGQGCLRALDLWSGKLKWQQDFDLEANTAPAIAASGPSGGPMVIVSLGATPGGPIKEGAFGDCWATRIVALDAASGAQLWAHDFEPWKNYGVRGSTVFQIYTPTAVTNPVIGGDGTIYLSYCGGWLYAIRSSDGVVTSGYDLGMAMQASPVIGPGFLVVASYEQVLIWRPWQDVFNVYEDGQVAAMDSTTEHFWPCKGGGNCPGSSSYKAPTDLNRPSWSYELTERRPHEFFYNSPVIDAHGHIILTSRYNSASILRPDGTLRARLHCGTALTNPAVLGDMFCVGSGCGWACAIKISTFECMWSRRYCVQANLDAASAVAAEGMVFLPGNASEIRKENKTLYCLDAADGHTRWTLDVRGAGLVDSRPVILTVDDLVIVADVEGGIHCAHLSDGTPFWYTNKEQAAYHRGCHICALAPTAQVFSTGSIPADGKWGAPYGGRGLVRAHDVGSGCRMWEKVFEGEELSVPAAVAPKHLPLFKPMLIIALGSRPGTPAKPTPHGLDGSGCMGDVWYGRLVALDCQNGVWNWSLTMPLLKRNSAPGNHADDVYNTPPFSAPVVGGDGTLYVAWAGGLFYAIEACTGRMLSTYDMGCAAAGSPAIAPGMVCIMSAFRLLVWRNSELEEEWRTKAALEDDPRAVPSQSRAPADVPAATWGVLHNVAEHGFTPESLRAYEWGQDFLKLEPLRKEASAVVVTKDTMEKHKADDGPLKMSKAVARARLGPAPVPKDASPPPPVNRSAPSTGPAQPAAAPRPPNTSAPKPAWLQALGDASLLMDDDEEPEPPPRKAPEAPRKTRWEVIGGAGKGGIVVRKGQDVFSYQLPDRLATGAVIEEVEVSGDRLSFKKIKGGGPDVGWVSQTFQGKPLLKRV